MKHIHAVLTKKNDEKYCWATGGAQMWQEKIEGSGGSLIENQ